MKVKAIVALISVLFFYRCNNLGLLDKLENPGGASSGSSGGEKFTTNNYIFVSSWTTQGDMSFTPFAECNADTGPNKADCACSRAAAANGLRRSSTHVFRAWLSTTSSDAKCRVQGGPNGCMTNIPTTWFNTQGQAVVNNFNGFEAALSIEVRYSESRTDIGPDLVWTGTSVTAGTYTGTPDNTCSSWTSTLPTSGTVGSRIVATTNWVNNGTATACNTAQRIYCVAAP